MLVIYHLLRILKHMIYGFLKHRIAVYRFQSRFRILHHRISIKICIKNTQQYIIFITLNKRTLESPSLFPIWIIVLLRIAIYYMIRKGYTAWVLSFIIDPNKVFRLILICICHRFYTYIYKYFCLSLVRINLFRFNSADR